MEGCTSSKVVPLNTDEAIQMKANKLTKETVLDYNVTDRGFPKFNVGDTIEVAQIVKEGNKERIQMFLGDVLCIKNNGIASTFTVRKMSANSVGVEKIFPYHSPVISKIKVVKKGDVRRSKLYYIRERVGKAARIKEKIEKKASAKKTKKVTAKPSKPEPAPAEKTGGETSE